ncbi:MAG: HAD hydrolase-like protein, partial [Calditrichia bacterium]|nr:HAD hydrolase-like protein [Calditrichia bacterium]
GDDLEADVRGAQKAGLSGILVKSGKFHDEIFAKAKTRPDVTIPSIAKLPNFISSK